MSTEHTLAENLIRLQEAKEDIADAIVEMGGTASSTDGLEDMPDNIRTIQTGGGMSNFYGTCTTAANQQVKEVIISQDQNFELKTGVIVAVLFANTNTYESTTENPIQLNINNTGNKTIKYSANNAGETNSATSYVYGYANRIVYYLYNGSYWLWLNHGVDANTTYSAMSASEANTGTSTTGRLISAKVLNDLIASKVGAVKTVTATYLQSNGYINVRNDGYNFLGVDQCCIFGSFGIYLMNPNTSGSYSSFRTVGSGTTLLTLTGITAPVNRTAQFDFYPTSSSSLYGSYLTIDSNSSTNEIYIKTASDIQLRNGGYSDSSKGFWGRMNIWFT